jgi:hypothetical protein
MSVCVSRARTIIPYDVLLVIYIKYLDSALKFLTNTKN